MNILISKFIYTQILLLVPINCSAFLITFHFFQFPSGVSFKFRRTHLLLWKWFSCFLFFLFFFLLSKNYLYIFIYNHSLPGFLRGYPVVKKSSTILSISWDLALAFFFLAHLPSMGKVSQRRICWRFDKKKTRNRRCQVKSLFKNQIKS